MCNMGKYITSIQQVYDSMKWLNDSINCMDELKGKLLKSKLCIQYIIADPEGQMYLDYSGDETRLYIGECPDSCVPNVTLQLKADTFHRYWSGSVNFMIATFKGDIKVKGDLIGLTKLVPLSNDLFKVYINNLKQNGMSELIPEQ